MNPKLESIIQMSKAEKVELLGCGGIFTYCTLAEITTIAQAVGTIASALVAIIILIRNVRKGI
jgi:hypothetical protein